MTKDDYRSSKMHQNLLSIIQEAIDATKDFRINMDLTEEQIDILAHYSDLIMKEMRNQALLIRSDYFEKFRNDKDLKITINPEDFRIQLHFDENFNTNEYYLITIPAYSFGPFNAKEYFRSRNRYLWLLKEPYCENPKELLDEVYKGNPNYYDQAKSNSNFDKIPKGAIKNAIVRTKDIDSIIRSLSITPNQVMDHICI